MSWHNGLVFFVTPLLSAFVMGAGTAEAYSQYSANRDLTNCRSCHGDFRASPYISLSDGQSWGDGLHNVHRNVMLNGDCSTCHGSGSRFPVLLNSSAGGTGLDPISCAGCHGRSEDGTGSGAEGFGAGLRQHHWASGVTNCEGCHPDANPANFIPVGEEILPPYYSNNDPDHPLIPSDSCNREADAFPEDYAGSTKGLDNDGNDLYDEADPIACPEPGQFAMWLSAIGMLFLIEGHKKSRSRHINSRA